MPLTRKSPRHAGVISLPKWPNNIIQKYSLTRYDLQPILPKGLAATWKGDKKKKKKAQYVYEAMPGYQMAHVITGNAIGFDQKGDLLFLYLHKIKGKPAISERVRKRALVGLTQMQFQSCNNSGRPELREAIRLNKHKNPEAGEINTGWMHLGRAFRIGFETQDQKKKAVAQHNAKQLHHFLPLLRAIDGHYAKDIPRQFGQQNAKIQTQHRHGFSPFSTLTFLRSAPSAVHVDARNGAGALACMTTIKPPSGSKGGEFCFVEYGVQIGVRPGDLLIAATPKHWHCNLSAVTGTKYSIICYFKDALRRKPPAAKSSPVGQGNAQTLEPLNP